MNYVEKFLREDRKILKGLPDKKIEGVIEEIYEAWKRGAKVFTMGNGGSASTANHLAADLSKTARVPGRKRVKALSLVNNDPLTSAWTNDEGFEELFKGQLENWYEEGDVLIGISVHGGTERWSSNLIKAMKYVNRKGGITIGLTGFDGGKMKEIADECVVVPSESTPQVESCHVLLHHLITFGLKRRIAKDGRE